MHFPNKTSSLIFLIATLIVLIAIVLCIIRESHSIAFGIIYPQ
jgi:hypothetical protein